jgi:UDPglucose 6-dehydrogenase
VAKIAMFGAGYVGLVTGACFADLGHDVVLRDVLPERVERLRAGEIPIYEPGLDQVVERNRDRLGFTTDVDEAVDDAEFLYVAVGTPPTESGDADLRYVWTVVDSLPESLPGRPVVVMKSTVPVGTGEQVRRRLDARGLTNVGYVSNPEFLAEGTALRDFMNPDRIVVGAFEPEDGDRVVDLHHGLETEVVRTDVASAELVKLAANAFLSTRISFINEIANVCDLVGADVVDVAKGVGLDHRLGPHFLRAGIGFGGSCFPKDVTALKQLAGNSGYQFQLLQAVWEVNELQKRRVIQKLHKHLGSLHGKRIALLGLAFKPNTDDMREAPSRVIAYRLLSEGAEVRAWDPVAHTVDLPGIARCDTVIEAVRDADAAVIVTEWPELASVASEEVRDVMAQPVIIDGRNLLDPLVAQRAGFVYEGIGRPRYATPPQPKPLEDLLSDEGLRA